MAMVAEVVVMLEIRMIVVWWWYWWQLWRYHSGGNYHAGAIARWPYHVRVTEMTLLFGAILVGMSALQFTYQT